MQHDYEQFKLCRAAAYFSKHPEEMLERGAKWIEWAWVTMTAEKLIEAAPSPKKPGEGEPMGDFVLVD